MKNIGNKYSRSCEQGSATALFIFLLAVMMILVTAEARSLIQLRREVKLVERHQIKRLNGSRANPLSTAKPVTK